MPPLPTIGNCVRVTLNWTANQGITPRNVLHLITASTNEQDIGLALSDAFQASPDAFQAVDDGFTLDSFDILRLDGTSPTVNYQLIGTPVTGGGSGEQVPAAAAVLSLRTNQRGPRGRGRLYLGPVSEAALTDGKIVSSYRTAMLGAWSDIEDDLAGSPVAASLGVASYVHAEVGGVIAISMREAAGTLRRRQNQLV